MLVDTFALGVQCDQFRFGSMVFLAQGARIRLSGAYDYGGRRVYDFDDIGDWNEADGRDNKTSHEFWHSYNRSDGVGDVAKRAARAHAHLMLRECLYFAKALDDEAHLDENGSTIFENSMVTFATESGSGDHNRTNANTIELANVFHAISPAGGRFQTGVRDIGVQDAADVYNTMLRAYGVTDRLGDGTGDVSGILA